MHPLNFIKDSFDFAEQLLDCWFIQPCRKEFFTLFFTFVRFQCIVYFVC